MEPLPIAAAPDQPALRTVTVGMLVSRSIATWKENVIAFAVVALAFQVPSLLIQIALGSPMLASSGNPFAKPSAEQAARIQEFMGSGRYLWVVAVSLAFGLLHTGAVTSGVIRHLAGGRASVGEMLGSALRRAAPLLLTGLLTLVAIAGAGIALIVPGVVVALMFSLVVPVLMAEPVAIRQVFGRSRALTKGSRLTLLAAFMILYVAAAAPAVVVRIAAGGLPALSVALAMLVGAVTGPLVHAAPGVAYHDLRETKEGGDTARLERVFE